MDINGYRYFVALEKYKTVSATARKLFMTQPALTNYIKRMEQELGVSLIQRGTTPVAFTKYGQIFLKYAKVIAEQDLKMREDLDSAHDENGNEVRIVLTSAGMAALSRCLSDIHTQLPNVRLNISELPLQDCEEQLVENTAELAFMTSGDLSEELETSELYRIPMAFVIAKDYPLIRGSHVQNNSFEHPYVLNAEVLNGQTFIVTSQKTGLYRFTKKFLEAHHIKPGKIIQLSTVSAGFHMASGGGGIVLLPESGIRKNVSGKEDIVYATLKNAEMCRYAVIAKNKKTQFSEAAQAVWNVVTNMKF